MYWWEHAALHPYPFPTVATCGGCTLFPCPARPRLTHRDSCETLSLNPPSTLHTHITPGFTPQL